MTKKLLRVAVIMQEPCENGVSLAGKSVSVTPPKLASTNPVESLAIYPFKPTYD